MRWSHSLACRVMLQRYASLAHGRSFCVSGLLSLLQYQATAKDLARFSKAVKFIAFKPFTNAADALEQVLTSAAVTPHPHVLTPRPYTTCNLMLPSSTSLEGGDRLHW